MRFAVLGTGVVGHTLGTKLVQLGHDVVMGSRDAANPKAVGWASTNGDRASAGSFADAAAGADVVVNATSGTGSLEALDAAGAEALAGKVLIDVSNPLDFSHGFPPALTVGNTDSLAEQIQRAFPRARVVKTLNTMNADVMVDPAVVAGEHDALLCGDDEEAKAQVRELLGTFGWPNERIVDVGPLVSARGMEAWLLLWVPLMQHFGTPHFNLRLQAVGRE